MSLTNHRSETHISWSANGQTTDVRIDGEVAFDEDLADVRSLSDGGHLAIRESSGGLTRTIDITSIDGKLTREYHVGGKLRPWSAEAQQLLHDQLLKLVRHSAIGAQARVRSIHARRGAAGVLDEIALLEGDYARRVYVTHLLELDSPSGDTVEKILTVVEKQMSSDYDRAEILGRLADRATSNDRTNAGFVRAAAAMKSDYDKRRVLEQLIAKARLNGESKAAVLAAAAAMRSDYDRAQVLTAYVASAGFESAVAAPFVTAVNAMTSDYEKRRVLTAVASKGVRSNSLPDLFGAVDLMHSDYDRAQVLLAFAPVVDASTRPAFMASAGRIRSKYDQDRVLGSISR